MLTRKGKIKHSASLPGLQMYGPSEQRDQRQDLHDRPNVSSLNLSATRHVSDQVTPYNENKQTHSYQLHIVHYNYRSTHTLVTGFAHCFLLQLLVPWRDSRVVSVLDFQSSSRCSSPAGRRWSRSNRGPVDLCTLGLGLLNPPPLNGR